MKFQRYLSLGVVGGNVARHSRWLCSPSVPVALAIASLQVLSALVLVLQLVICLLSWNSLIFIYDSYFTGSDLLMSPVSLCDLVAN